MVIENHPSSGGDSNHESIEMDPLETQQRPPQDLEDEGNELWAVHQRRFVSTDGIIVSIIAISILAFMIQVVILVLVFTGTVCLCFR